MNTLPAIRTIAAGTMLEALRNRLHWLVLLLAVCAVALAGLLQQLALTETRETQALLLGALLRLAATGLVASFVVTSMVREAQDGSLQMVLALAIPRSAWLAGRCAGFALFALLTAFACTLLCLPVASARDAVAWGCGLAFECWIVAAFAAFATLSLRQPVPALALVAAFYLLARSAATLALLGHAPAGASQPLGAALDALALLLPRLDTFASAGMLAYGASLDTMPMAAAQTAIYLALLAAATLFDLQRKEL